MYNLSEYTGIVILPVQVKCRNLISLYVSLPSPFKSTIVLNTSSTYIQNHINVINFASSTKYNLEDSRRRETYYIYLYFCSICSSFFQCSYIPSFIPSFLLRVLPLAILLEKVCY